MCLPPQPQAMGTWWSQMWRGSTMRGRVRAISTNQTTSCPETI
uniref:Uncharacterized protein n=1 Tax=Anguilla anguilla TaxID=7936 RepID=A0A0E9XV68_ANGAN